ncbi:MAG: hypothetical protein KGJ89_01820 [Patescibacteria group bacterium]|nr:cohesin domain-containing protein [Patescibacteria group bacterium]MDE2015615.1 hypothetical protein [Patescibacteria group bacterium]MDE2226672.1 hypothetical protein [Patescibacteria group bacterium]
MERPHKIGGFCLSSMIAGGFFLFAVFFAVISPIKAEAAASLYVSPPSGTFTVGSTFTVSIYVNSGGQSINAVEADLKFPADRLQVVSPTTGKSLIQVWVSQPTYSNLDGTMKFQGTIPSPGINTDSGLISTVTFRVKSVGTASLQILDSSQVLLNDGLGTNILGQTTSGIYYLVLPAPAGPIVTSRTNPDQSKWYSTHQVVFEWSAPSDIQGYSYILDQDPSGEPDDISEGTNTRVVYDKLADGTYYFHIKSLRQGAWGGITDYVVNIDNDPPAKFTIDFSPGDTTSNHRPIIDFTTTDKTSGLDHYELKIIPLDMPLAVTTQNDTPFFIETQPPYSQQLADGRYDVYVRAYDKAGNYYQAESRLTITKPIFEFLSPSGLSVNGFTLGWAYTVVLGLLFLALFGYFGYKAWTWHRLIEESLEHGPHKHPVVAEKLEELKKKQKEYGSSGGTTTALLTQNDIDGKEPPGSIGGTGLMILFALVISLALFGHAVKAQQNATGNVSVEPPIVTLFPKSISNDEIFYIGGRAGAPNAKVYIYLQNVDTGSALNEIAVTDVSGAWFYSFPQFLTAGRYIVWTQLKVSDALSSPSPQMNLEVAPTAIQFGGNRFSYQDLYFVLLLIFLAAFCALLAFIIYHSYHFRIKNRRLSLAIAAAEESIRRGFSVLRRDIEEELSVIRKVKLNKELSTEEKIREEKLTKDFEDVNRYVGKEIWEVDKEEKDL